AVCRFDIAVNRSYKDSNGEWQKDVCYVPIVVWRDAAIRCSERLKKGSPVHISGRLRTRSYEDKNGQKRNVLEVEAQRIQFLQIVEDTKEPEEIPEIAEDSSVTETEEDVPF
ncbi:MAG: single-stranded DNA-binding protein, partial [Endomicrobiia bacterium]